MKNYKTEVKMLVTENLHTYNQIIVKWSFSEFKSKMPACG